MALVGDRLRRGPGRHARVRPRGSREVREGLQAIAGALRRYSISAQPLVDLAVAIGEREHEPPQPGAGPQALLDQGPRDDLDRHLVDRDHRGGARRPRQDRGLAEDLARSQAPDQRCSPRSSFNTMQLPEVMMKASSPGSPSRDDHRRPAGTRATGSAGRRSGSRARLPAARGRWRGARPATRDIALRTMRHSAGASRAARRVRSGSRNSPLRARVRRLARARPFERRPPGQDEIEQRAQPEHVGALADLGQHPLRLLGRHERRRAAHARLREALGRDRDRIGARRRPGSARRRPSRPGTPRRTIRPSRSRA